MAHVGKELGLRQRRFFEALIQRNESGVAFNKLLLTFA